MAYKRLGAGRGKMFVPALIHTVGAGVENILKEINVVNRGGGYGPHAYYAPTTQFHGGMAWNKVSGDIFIAIETCVYRIESSGKVSVLAGFPGTTGTTDGTGTAARFNSIRSMVCDNAGNNLYVADANTGGVLRKIVISTGVVTTIAGQFGTSGTGDNATGTSGTMQQNQTGLSMAADDSKVYVAQQQNLTIRTVSTTAPYALGTVTFTGGAGVSIMDLVVSSYDPTKIFVVQDGLSTGNQVTVYQAPVAGGALTLAAQLSIDNGVSSGNSTVGTQGTGSHHIAVDETRAADGAYGFYFNTAGDGGPKFVAAQTNAAGTWTYTVATPICGAGYGKFGSTFSSPVNTFTEGVGADASMNSHQTHRMLMANGCVLMLGYAPSLFTFFIAAYGLDDGYVRRVAGVVSGSTTSSPGGAQSGGSALVGASSSFNLYVVPSAESLDRTKHCRFPAITVEARESWLGEIAKNLETGDKIYFEALGPNLTYELSGLEA